MLFNSLQFGVFFVIVYFCYLFLNHKWQNRLLLLASYIFYGAWDWRFLSLIFFSTLLDYACGLKIYNAGDTRERKLFLFFSMAGNLAILGFFKYFDFFVSSLQGFLTFWGIHAPLPLLKIVLPVGVSFYTFQTMSYTIDIYRRELKPTADFLDFALFVSLFTQLVAGPIERAKQLLPQILSPRKFDPDQFYEGCYLFFWGLYQKIFIADNLAKIVDPVFASLGPYNGIHVLLVSYAFAFQILCDFDGYSNMARGLGKLLGFDIMVNFNLPYFATNPREFWRRWHISLSSWLRDYVYIPLGGNRGGTRNTYRNLMVAMLLGGLWHGAAWTFVVWGAYHGLLLVIYRLLQPHMRRRQVSVADSSKKSKGFLKPIFFFQLVCLGWLIFRAQSLSQLGDMLLGLTTDFVFTGGAGLLMLMAKFFFFISPLLILQIIQYKKDDLLIVLKARPVIQMPFYLLLFYSMLFWGVTTGNEFIYFQF